jgi:hypothetical protein
MKPTSRGAYNVIVDEHAAVAAVLRSLQPLVEQGPGDEPERFFDVLRAMPKIARKAPQLMEVIGRLEADHMQGEHRVRELQHQLLAWELLGESRRAAFVQNLAEYVRFYLDHMRTEETQILPVARRVLDAADWADLDRAFEATRDPLAGGAMEPAYDRLFTRIVLATPAPLGVGPEMHRQAA